MRKNITRALLSVSALLLVFGLAGCKKTTEFVPEDWMLEEYQVPADYALTQEDTDAGKKLAEGAISYVAASYEERTEILGLLEKYAVEHNLTGLTMYENGGFVMYDESVEKGAETYIPGYGFGIISEGQITADLASESNSAWKRYYHSYQSDDPGKLNYMNAKDSVVGDLNPLVAASYWDQAMNETKDGYEWIAALSNDERPVAVNYDEVTKSATIYKFEVKTSTVKYSTLTSVASLAAFNNTSVKLQDYITPYQIYYTQAFGLARSNENLSGAGSLKGSDAYYKASKTAFDADAFGKYTAVEAGFDAAKFAAGVEAGTAYFVYANGTDATNGYVRASEFAAGKAYFTYAGVGVRSYVENGKSYLEFEFNIPCSQFYAMYYLASSMFAPVPAEFISALGAFENAAETDAAKIFAAGVQFWGAASSQEKGNLTIKDTWLSTGPFVVEEWASSNCKQIVFKKNANFTSNDLTVSGVESDSRYRVAGVHYLIFKAIKTDANAAFKEFIKKDAQGNNIPTFHAVSIPKDYLNEYKSDSRTTTTVGSTTYKLNMNTCTQDYWNYLFGVKGTITETEYQGYWECEPAMSNAHFLAGLNYAFDRATLATALGRTPSIDYFGHGYQSNPEEGIVYDATPEHKQAVANLDANYGESTSTFGFNLAKAKQEFKAACEELIAAGIYQAGDTIEIEMAWMEKSDIDDFGAAIEKNFEDAFNACGGGLTLDVVHWYGEEWNDVYYVKMMLGQFDIGFGSVSGNALNPINFLEVLRSDNSSGFTLNWGTNTDVVSKDLFYDGMYWSFDALWTAADQGGYFEKGHLTPAIEFKKTYFPDDSDFFTVGETEAVALVEVSLVEVEGVSVSIDATTEFFGRDLASGGKQYLEIAVKEASIVWMLDGQEVAKGTDGAKSFIKYVWTLEDFNKFKDGCIDEVGYVMIDTYVNVKVCGVSSQSCTSVYFNFGE